MSGKSRETGGVEELTPVEIRRNEEGEDQKSLRERAKGLLARAFDKLRESRGIGANIPKNELPRDIKNNEEVMEIVTEGVVDTINGVVKAKDTTDILSAAAYIDHLNRLANDPEYARSIQREEAEERRERAERADPAFKGIYETLDRTTNPITIEALHERLEEERMLQTMTPDARKAYKKKKDDEIQDRLDKINAQIAEEKAREPKEPNYIPFDRAAYEREKNEAEERRERAERADPELAEAYKTLDSTTNPIVAEAMMELIAKKKMLRTMTPEARKAYVENEDDKAQAERDRINARIAEEKAKEAATPTQAEMDRYHADRLLEAQNNEARIAAEGDKLRREAREALVVPELVAKFLKEGLNLRMNSGNIDLSNTENWNKILQILSANNETTWKAQSLKDEYKSIAQKAKEIMWYGREGQIHQDVKDEFDKMCENFTYEVYSAAQTAKLNLTQFIESGTKEEAA